REVEPELAYQPRDDVRLTLLGSLAARRNREGAERADIRSLGCEGRWQRVGTRVVRGAVRYVRIDYRGETASPLAYEMLEALLPGNNITWDLNWQQKLTNGLQLQLAYEGRTSERSAPVHTGRMQVTALF
ncbi:MAG: hypothetical protein WBA12_03705, partial [Catalinimonas sp.]